jgi:hypothetical protein
MLSNSLVQPHNVNRLACHITMKVVSADSCSMVGCTLLGARAACAEVCTVSVEASKASLGAIWHLVYAKNMDTIRRRQTA